MCVVFLHINLSLTSHALGAILPDFMAHLLMPSAMMLTAKPANLKWFIIIVMVCLSVRLATDHTGTPFYFTLCDLAVYEITDLLPFVSFFVCKVRVKHGLLFAW